MAFITTDQLDAFLGATDAALYSDEFKALAVDVACDAVESYCGRLFAADDYREWYKSSGGCLSLRQFPLLALRRACVGTTTVGTLANSSTDAVSASGAVINNTLRLTVVGGANASDSALTLSAYSTMALLAAAVTALGKDWTLTVDTEESPRCLREEGWSNLLDGTTASLSGPGAAIAVDVDYRTAAMVSASAGDVFVDYRAGYEVIPSDLIGVACGISRDWLASGTGTRPAMMEQRRLGDFSHNLMYGADKGLFTAYKPILDNYRRLDWGIL